ncbi:hypothetical protein ACFSTC_34650 [Nonomuraea ferruginea]
MITEESGLLGASGGEWTWLVDPLDGTNNVAIGLPAYVVGLALCRVGRAGARRGARPGDGADVVGDPGPRRAGPVGVAAVGVLPALSARAAPGLDPGVCCEQARRQSVPAEVGPGAERQTSAAAVGPVAAVGDARPWRHRRHRRLPRGGDRSA